MAISTSISRANKGKVEPPPLYPQLLRLEFPTVTPAHFERTIPRPSTSSARAANRAGRLPWSLLDVVSWAAGQVITRGGDVDLVELDVGAHNNVLRERLLARQSIGLDLVVDLVVELVPVGILVFVLVLVVVVIRVVILVFRQRELELPLALAWA
ncbi:MAG: hypothetical protein K2Y71_15525 [Xanthobacteraceae bacterium]|nr:hypothetical protein [Xanthobacteraceae bacterium]